MSKMFFGQNFGFSKLKKLFLPEEKALFKGSYGVEHWRMKKSGNLYLRESFEFLEFFNAANGISNEGKNKILNVMFVSATQIASSAWCLSLIDNAGTPVLSSADTYATHGGWTEFTTYTESTRVAWGAVTSTAQLLTNSTLCVFDISTSGTVYGGYVVSNNTKGDTAASGAVLWSTGAFPSPVPVTGGTDQLRLTYNLSC